MSPSPPTGAQASRIADLLGEDRVYSPPPGFTERAAVRSPDVWEEGRRDPKTFWAKWARELEWSRPWETVLDWQPPHARWFVGGKINVSVNCVDRHIRDGRRNKAAIVWEGEPGEMRTLTYWDLHREVNKCANMLRRFGVQKGDRVAIYMPMIPELAVSMLACARIGAVHTVVFGGFSAEALADRINDAQAKVLITADGGYRRGSILPLKHDADYAVKDCPSIQTVIVVRRQGFPLRMKEGRDHWWSECMDDAGSECEPEELDSEHPLYILYTSGTTGKPKGIVHTTGGYMTGVYATTKWVFDLRDDDLFWCTADIGWVTGHSYVVYGPLAAGATVLMYEGAPDWPDQDRFWGIVAKYGVTVFYTAPTAIRAFMKWGAHLPDEHDLSTLRLLGSVGEPLNPEAWVWYHEHIGGGRCPIVDTWWQTETGAIMVTTLPGISTMRPGYAGVAFPGIEATVLDDAGAEIEPGGGGGCIAITEPWPSMLRTVWGDPERYVETYWTRWKETVYFPGDGAKRDEEGAFLFLGRVDDVLSIAGHRIGTMEVESALVDHPSVAEAAVVGVPHEIKGHAISAFVTLRAGFEASREIQEEIREHVVKKIGPIARPDQVIFSGDLPKTRSGKIMRRLLRDIATGKVLGDTTTLADASVLETLRRSYEETEQ